MFTFVVLPDFQSYCDVRLGIAQKIFGMADQREMMQRQVDWVLAHAGALRVRMVFQEGDLTQTNHPDEWDLASAALGKLDGRVPYMVCAGNHDMGYEAKPPAGRFWVSNRRDSLLTQYFPPERFARNPGCSYAGNLDGSSENYFVTFEADGLRFLALTLEFMPRDEALAWANGVIAAHPDRRCVVMTHGYLDGRGARNLRGDQFGIEGNSATAIWDKFLRKHPQIFLVLSGHDHGEARRTDRGDHGNEVHQVMANFQWWKNGGSGWLRLMTFHPSEDRIDVSTYSPVLDRHRRRPSSQFSLPYTMTRDPNALSLSLFQRRKLHHFFGLLDADSSGTIEVADFFAFREHLANVLGLEEDDPAYRTAGTLLTRLFQVHIGAAGQGTLTSQEFLEHWSANMASLQEGPEKMAMVDAEIALLSESLFDLIDVNDDGEVGMLEFMLLLKAMGVNDGQIPIFRRLDLDGDGTVSRNELAAHAREFFLGDDPTSVSSELFGPLR